MGQSWFWFWLGIGVDHNAENLEKAPAHCLAKEKFFPVIPPSS